MDENTLSKLREIRDRLLREVKQEKSEEYKSGYTDGVLDMHSSSTKELTHIGG